MSARHAADALFGYDVEKRVTWVGRDRGGRFARKTGTHSQRRTNLGKPRPAHAGAPQTMMGIPVDRLVGLMPHVAPGIRAAAELQLAIDRVRAMFDDQRATALIKRAAEESKGTPEPLTDAINRIASAAARADQAKRTPLGGLDLARQDRAMAKVAERTRSRLVRGATIDPPTTEEEDHA